MKMPQVIDSAMLAPCGVNCMVCYKHCNSKKPCAGCNVGDEGKPPHCRTCRILGCICKKGHEHCFECAKHPCKLIKNLDKSYCWRYGASLIENAWMAQSEGIDVLVRRESERWRCPHCGGIISLTEGICSDCERSYRMEING